MLPSTSISKQRSVENNGIIAIAFLRPKIALSSKGVSVAMLRGKRTMGVREKNRKDESVMQSLQCLMAQRPHVKEKPRVNWVVIIDRLCYG